MEERKRKRGMKSLVSYVLATAMLTTSIPTAVFGSAEELPGDYQEEAYTAEASSTAESSDYESVSEEAEAAPAAEAETTAPAADTQETGSAAGAAETSLSDGADVPVAEAVAEEMTGTSGADDLLSDGTGLAQAMPAIEFEKITDSGLKIQVSVPENVFPEGTIVDAADVPETEMEALKAQLQEDLDGQLTGEIVKVLAADISFTKDDISLVPGTDVKVTMVPADNVKTELKEKEEKGLALSLVYVPAEGEAAIVADEKIETKTLDGISFEAVQFPRYAIVATAQVEEESSEEAAAQNPETDETSEDDAKEDSSEESATEEVKEEPAAEVAEEAKEETTEESDELSDGVSEETTEAAGEAEEQEQILSARAEGIRSGYYTTFTAVLSGATITASAPYYLVSTGTTMEVAFADASEYEPIIRKSNYGKAITDLKAVEISFADRRGRKTMLLSTSLSIELDDTGAERYLVYEPYRGWFGTELYQLATSRTPKFNLYSYSDTYVLAGLKADGIDRAAGVTRRGKTSFALKAGNASFSVEAEKNTFSGSVSMEAAPVDAESVAEAVNSVLPEGMIAESIQAFDISFHNSGDGEEVEPGKEVTVTIALPLDEEAEYSLVHVKDDGTAEIVENARFSADGVTFSAGGFSVYAVVKEGTDPEEARATVNFYGVDREKPIATVYVKNSDTSEDLETIVYDPGVGDLSSDLVFKGWSFEEDPDVPSGDNEILDISEIRSYLETLDIQEGTIVDIYGMLFKHFTVTYHGEKEGVSLGNQAVLVKRSEDSISYTVNMAYTADGDKNFEGWNVSEGGSNIVGYTTGTTYKNGTTIEITGDVTFSVYAPSGQWLIFHEEGGSYVAPQFIKSGEVTKEPTITMKKLGYTFVGWYTENGTEFTFGNTLTDKTELYARWEAEKTANYVVIIWKQNVNDAKDAADSAKTYDFADSITLSGTVGSTINTVTATGNGNNRYARVNGANKRYDGFHLNKYDENVTISPSGNSILNVYYDRNLVTLTFRPHYIWGWGDTITMTGLYGSSLASNGYTWPTNRWWYEDYYSVFGFPTGGSGTRTTFLDAFILANGEMSETFYGFGGDGSNEIHFAKENPDVPGDFVETTVVEVRASFFGNNGFNISDKYNGYKAVSYKADDGNWVSLGEKDSNGYYASPGFSENLYIRFSPLKYNISYDDGVYVDGDGNKLSIESAGQWKTATDIIYGSNISSYNKDGANYYDPTGDERVKDGFVFAGWYIDDQCTQPYTFTTMTEGITVYAKWQQVQYRVFLHPDVPTSDTSLNWGTETQAMSFRVSNGEKVSAPTGTRNSSEFIAWYTDEGKTKLFNADAFVLNDTTVTTPYDKTQSTERDKYGNETSTENSDVSKDRYWITRQLDLYAKWRAKLDGAEGIGIIYDLNGGSGTISDTTLYLDQAEANAKQAGTAPPGQQFVHWVVQKWDPTENDFVDTNVSVYPGDSFTVLKENAHEENITDGSQTTDVYKTYTIKLRAEYAPEETPANTHITWYGNGGTLETPVSVKVDETTGKPLYESLGTKGDKTTSYIKLQINEAVPVASAETFTRDGYRFLGWAREEEPDGAFVKNEEGDTVSYSVDESKFAEDDNLKLWLKLNDDGVTFSEVDENGTVLNDSVTQVAADENKEAPYHALYAVWEEVFYIYHSSDQSVDVVSMKDCEGGKFNIVSETKEGYYYGGYYTDYLEKGNYVGGSKATYDGKNYEGGTGYWNYDDACEENGTAMTPESGKTYYLKEVLKADYLKNYVHFAYYYNHLDSNNTDNYLVKKVLFLTDIDDGNYSNVFITIGETKKDITATTYKKYTLTTTNNTNSQNQTVKSVFTVADTFHVSRENPGYISLLSTEDYIPESDGETVEYTLIPSWVTVDGVEVTGYSNILGMNRRYDNISFK